MAETSVVDDTLSNLRESKKPATQSFVLAMVDAITSEMIPVVRAQATRIEELENTVARLRREMEANT